MPPQKREPGPDRRSRLNRELARKYPLMMTIIQAAEMVQVPKATIYEWSSKGMLNLCKLKLGRHVRINRDRFLRLIESGRLASK